MTGAASLYWLARRAEPVYSGTLTLTGLTSPVRVGFGPHAVPTIAADNLQDLLFAQGYVVASERLWQMDTLRRLASGRLAEVFGADALPADRFFRTVGLAHEARRTLESLEASDRDLLAAYAAGVNAYRNEARARLPLEYRIAGFAPAPWQPEDSLVIGGYMAWTQSFNLRAELTFLRLAARIGPARARELFPTDEGIPAPDVSPELVRYLSPSPSRKSLTEAPSLDSACRLPARFGLPIPGAASNAWVANGSRTATGAAMLANDPHLAPSMPGIWYELELIAPELHLSGVTLPGVPLVLIGHNEHLAWGFTSAIADTQDLFVERATPDGRVERAGSDPEPILSRIERIPVKDAEPVELAVRRTSHGVIVNGILGDATDSPMDLPGLDTADLLALRQNNDLPDLSFAAIHRLARSRTLSEAREASTGFRQVALNLMLAHRDGGIAWQVTGLLPKRGKGSGAFPSPGWLPEYAWRGFVPQRLNPAQTDPTGGALITANNRTIPADYPVAVSRAWMAPYRAQRIAELLAGSPPLTPASMADIQRDRLSLQARLMQRSLRRIEMELRAVDARAWDIASDSLLDWNGVMDGDSPSAALFILLEPALFEALYGDELGEDLAALMEMAMVAYNPLQETLRSGQSSFWDDATTPMIETPAEIWARAILAATADLKSRSGVSGKAPLERIRTLTFPHAFDKLPVLGPWFSVGPIGVAGGTDTVNVMKATPLKPEQALFAPSMRVVATPADWTQTRGTLPLGQSGHRFSPYRTDQLDDWLAGDSHPWPWNGPVDGNVVGQLLLMPLD
ncbi:penicillin acylase family protein [Thiocystis minor]|uniref:penicillin acylase family protein n=1 Tax=Thiocystis minor TaxID=61597 RepID=UPI0030B87C68